MIIEELVNSLVSLMVIGAYPIILILNVIFTFLNTIYVSFYQIVLLILTLSDNTLIILRDTVGLFLLSPWLLIYGILLALIIFKFLKRRLGEIEIAGFRFGGG